MKFNNNKHASQFYRSNLVRWMMLIFTIISLSISAQKENSRSVISAYFIQKETIITESTVISNVLKITNNNGKVYKLKLKLNIPKGWKSILDPEKEISVNPKDSVFIPVRVVPYYKNLIGGTKYSINIGVFTTEDQMMAAASFFADKPSISKWDVNILPRSRIYFLNEDRNAEFKINVSNDGDEPKNVILSFDALSKNFTLGDSAHRKLKKNYVDVLVKPYTDTIISMTANLEKPLSNLRRIDAQGYTPKLHEEQGKYSLVVKAGEMGNSKNKGTKNRTIDFVKLSNNIDFIKLNDNLKLNPYGAAKLPLTMDLNMYNILGGQPIMNTFFYGNTRISPKSLINYQLQSNLSSYYLSDQALKRAFGNISWYHEKGFVIVGNTGISLRNSNTGSIGIGNGNGIGLAGGYNFSSTRSIYGFIAKNTLSKNGVNPLRYGIGYSDVFENNIRVGLSYTHFQNSAAIITDAGQMSLSFNPTKTQSLNFAGVLLYNQDKVLVQSFLGNRISAVYSINSFKSKLRTNLRYISYNSIYRQGLKGYNVGLTNFLQLKQWSFQLQNNYISNDYQYGNTVITNSSFANRLNIIKNQIKPFNTIPFVFFNYSNYANSPMVSRGVGISGNFFNYDKNIRVNLFLKGGYNKLLNVDSIPNFFTAQFFTLLQYRTFNFNFRYNYGPQGVTTSLDAITGGQYAQAIFISSGYQFLFKNKQFIFEPNANYSYLTSFKKHSFGLYPTLYFYTYNGWRFNSSLGYNFNSTMDYTYEGTTVGSAPVAIETGKRTKNQYFQLNVGIRKEFAITIPKKFANTKYCNAKFISFLDLNGNKTLDRDEVPIENIVIRLNEDEVLTNKSGVGTFENCVQGKYRLEAFSLVDLGAWFPLIDDSVEVCAPFVHYIPFTKGVKVVGSIEVQREKFSNDLYENLDISRIKVFLTDSSGKTVTTLTNDKGDFSFYVPYGNYNLSMDEKILSEKFSVAQNNIFVELTDGMDNFYYTFFIVEKKRKVAKKKFTSSGQLISETSEVADVAGGKKDNTTPSAELKEIERRVALLDSVEKKFLSKLISPPPAGIYESNGSLVGLSENNIPEPNDTADLAKLVYTIELAYAAPGKTISQKFTNLVKSGESDKATLGKELNEQNALLDGLKRGNIQWYVHNSGAKTLINGSYNTRQEADNAKANLITRGFNVGIEVKAIYQNKVMTIKEAEALIKK